MRKIIPVLIVIFLIIILIFLAISRSGDLTATQEYGDLPTPNPRQLSAQKGLYVVNTEPPNKSKDFDTRNSIVIFFNKNLSINDVKVEFSPIVDFDVTVDKSALVLIPKKPLTSDTEYEYTIRFSGSNSKNTYKFKTLANGAQPSVEADSPQARQESEKYHLANEPDLYLANKTPYENNSFSIMSEYKFEPTGHFYFILTLKGTDKENSKNEALNWLKSLGLTMEQIQNLDIENR